MNSSKTIITVATTGAWPTKANNPNVPMTPEEIAEDVYTCWKAGAAIAHLHMRDDQGKGTMDKNKFRETVELLRTNHPDCDIILNMTTSGALTANDDDRMVHLQELRPELGTYDCGSMNWLHTGLFLNPPAFLEKLGKNMQEWGIKPEIEIFDTGMLYSALYYIKKGVLKAPCHFQIVLGAPGGMTVDLDHLLYLHRLLPENCTWSACGIGKGHMPVMLTTIALGGHLRVGMEDNVMYHKGIPAKSNAQFVARAKRLLEEAGYQAASPEEARQIYGLRPRT